MLNVNPRINSALTDTQAELISRISSMKNLLTLPSIKSINISKDKHITVYEYTKRVIDGMGFPLDTVLSAFLTRVFDENNGLLENYVLKGIASSYANRGIRLPDSGILPITGQLISELTTHNLEYIKAIIPDNFLTAFKEKIAKDLVLMMFGPKDGPSSEYLNPDPQERQYLIDEAICSRNAFSLLGSVNVQEENLEVSRIDLARQLERGVVTFNINCQNVSISLPNDPSIIFESRSPITQTSIRRDPAQSLTYLVEYVGIQTQRINNSRNRESAGQSFFEILVQTLISNMASIISPIISTSFQNYQPQLSQINNSTGIAPEDLAYSTCTVMNSPNVESTNTFGRSICNDLYQLLISIMVIFVLREVKKISISYFAKSKIERQKRRAERIRRRFGILGNIEENYERSARIAKAKEILKNILPDDANTI